MVANLLCQADQKICNMEFYHDIFCMCVFFKMPLISQYLIIFKIIIPPLSMAHQKELILATIAVLITASALFSLAPESLQGNLTKQNLKCVARSTMISRGQAWVDAHVPYSQTSTHDGYRTDCSGFVSMCWLLAKPGLTTFTMHTVARDITRAELQAGDAMNCDSRHIVLFAGWADAAKNQYVAMQQANSQTGTIKTTIPYPYFNGDTCFHPIRYNQVC